jgi:hypothetical protein
MRQNAHAGSKMENNPFLSGGWLQNLVLFHSKLLIINKKSFDVLPMPRFYHPGQALAKAFTIQCPALESGFAGEPR